MPSNNRPLLPTPAAKAAFKAAVQASTTPQEVALRTGFTLAQVHNAIEYCRRHGIKLKRFRLASPHAAPFRIPGVKYRGLKPTPYKDDDEAR